jgi:glycosyltransferase involved in cell wall biosynthesis
VLARGDRPRGKDSVAAGSQASARALLGGHDGADELGAQRNLVSVQAVSTNGHAAPRGNMKVLHVLEAVAGGTLRHLVDILDTVPEVDHHVVLPPDHAHPELGEFSINAIAAQEMLDAGATIHRIEMVRNPVHPKNAAGVARLRRLVDRLQPAVVHGHSSVGGAFARAAVWGTSVPDIYTPNGVARSRAILMVEKVLAHRTSRFVAVSASEGERALSLGLTSAERMVVIPNGIDLAPPDDDKYDLRKELQLHADVPLVGTVSRLTGQKAPEDFVRICAEVARTQHDVHFVLIGNGQLQREFDNAVAQAGLIGRFHQIAFLRRASLAISQLNVFVLASRFEGAAYAPLEAMQAGVPVVLTDVTGNKDTVEDGVSGLLFPFGETSAMADGVLSLLSDDPRRQTLAQGGQERVRSHFDRRQMGTRLQHLYAEFV